VAGFGGPGFRIEATFHDGERSRSAEVTYTPGNRRKQIVLDGAPVARLSEAVGAWLAVAFLPRDVALAGGPATERRQYSTACCRSRRPTTCVRWRATGPPWPSGTRHSGRGRSRWPARSMPRWRRPGVK